jgi:hypothetical protein
VGVLEQQTSTKAAMVRISGRAMLVTVGGGRGIIVPKGFVEPVLIMRGRQVLKDRSVRRSVSRRRARQGDDREVEGERAGWEDERLDACRSTRTACLVGRRFPGMAANGRELGHSIWLILESMTGPLRRRVAGRWLHGPATGAATAKSRRERSAAC